MKNSNLIYIENGQLSIGILANIGGRIMDVHLQDSPNVIKSEIDKSSKRIEIDANTPFETFNGIITWLGPQSHWWRQQNIQPEKNRRADVWPPDPYLTFGPYEVERPNDSTIILISPESPISGIQLIKTITLKENKFTLSQTIKNIRDSEVAWDIWSNARFEPKTSFRVPVSENYQPKIDASNTEKHEAIESEIQNGFFTIPLQFSNDKNKNRTGKAFLSPAEPVIFALSENCFIEIKFDAVADNLIHPEQSLVEVYYSKSTNGKDDLLELEHHGPYKSLLPNETMTVSETWTLLSNPEQRSIDNLIEKHYK